MITIRTPEYYILLDAVSQAVPLTPEQKELLRIELTDPRYSGLTDGEALRKLCLPYKEASAPQTYVEREFWEPDVLKNLMLNNAGPDGINYWIKVKMLTSSEDMQLKVLGESIIEAFTLKAINVKNPLVRQGLDTIKLIGIIPEDVYTNILYELDPTWTPEVEMPPRIIALFGENKLPSIEEISEARSGA